MTALERAESIVTRYTPSGHDSLRDAIYRAIIDHSNAELERRRKVEARLGALIEWLWESGSPRAARMAEEALKALEGSGDEQAKRKQIREDNMIGEAGI